MDADVWIKLTPLSTPALMASSSPRVVPMLNAEITIPVFPTSRYFMPGLKLRIFFPALSRLSTALASNSLAAIASPSPAAPSFFTKDLLDNPVSIREVLSIESFAWRSHFSVSLIPFRSI